MFGELFKPRCMGPSILKRNRLLHYDKYADHELPKLSYLVYFKVIKDLITPFLRRSYTACTTNLNTLHIKSEPKLKAN